MLSSTPQATVRAALLQAGTPGRRADLADWSARVCRVAVEMLSASGATVTAVKTGAGPADQLRAASDFSTRTLQDAQVTTGQGPSIDASVHQWPVLVPDLDDGAATRWPAFTALARARAVAAVFAYPLQVGAARLGVLTVYRHRPGTLTRDERWIVAALADAATDGLLDGGDHDPDAPGVRDLAGGFAAQQVLYQAQGMVMADLGVTITEAVARLRQHANDNNARISDLAREIVAGRLRLPATPHTSTDTKAQPDS